MGIKSFVKKTLKAAGLNFLGSQVFAAFNFVLKPLLNALIDLPKPPKNVQASGTQYNADVRFNEARLGDVKPTVHGEARVWFTYCSMPYKEFLAHDQVLKAYLHATVGEAEVTDFRIGDTAAGNFPGFVTEVLQPGEDMTLIRPNVYTCPEVSGVEMYGGLLAPLDVTDHVTVKARTEFTMAFDSGASTVTYLEPVLQEFIVGDVVGFRLDATDDNEGIDFTLVSISDDYQTATLSPAPTSVSAGGGTTFLRQRWAGPFPACPPGSTVDTIAIDFVFAALRNPDEADNKLDVTIKIQYREIDDAGNFTGFGTWTEETVIHEDDVNRPRRYTDEFVLSSPMRCEVRVWRVQAENSDIIYSSAVQWVGLKGYIVPKIGDAPASDADSTRLAVMVRSSGLLSAQSERTLNGWVRRKVPIYESGGWTSAQLTRNPIWNAADWLVRQSNGAVTQADLDSAELVDLAATADANEDTFDGVFDRQVNYREGANTILRVTRAKLIKDTSTGLYTFYRDELADPVQMYCDGFNCAAGTDAIQLPDADTPTGVIVKFTDPILWQQREGPTVGTSDDPRVVDVMGMTTYQKSWEEEHYEYRDLYYRKQTVSIQTEMDGLLPRHGKRILLCSKAKGWGQAGEVLAQDGSNPLILTVRPAVTFTPGLDHYVYLQDEDGTPVGPIGATDLGTNFILLDSDPGITYRTGSGWKTLFAFGHDGDGSTDPDAPRVAIVQSRKVDGQRRATLDLLFENEYVHEDPGAAPPDPYALTGTIPDLTITGLTAEAAYAGTILDETGDPILDEDGLPLLDESEAFGITIHADWDDVSGASYYVLRWRYVGDPSWNVGYTGIASEAFFGASEAGNIQIRVKAYSGAYIGAEAHTNIIVVAPAGSP